MRTGIARIKSCEERAKKTYILIFRSSPPEANMHGSVGFHATTLTQPGI